MLWLQSTMLFHYGMPPAAVGTENRSVQTTQHQNCVVCHQQLKHLSKKFTEHTCRLPSGTVPWVEIHLLSMLWITDGKQMKQTIVPHPRNMAEGVPCAPEQILKLVKYGYVSERPCKGANCGCMGHQLPCSMFCACGGGRAYLNAF